MLKANKKPCQHTHLMGAICSQFLLHTWIIFQPPSYPPTFQCLFYKTKISLSFQLFFFSSVHFISSSPPITSNNFSHFQVEFFLNLWNITLPRVSLNLWIVLHKLLYMYVIMHLSQSRKRTPHLTINLTHYIHYYITHVIYDYI